MVHPRVGGEHDTDEITITISAGSSPRGRGTLFRPKHVVVVYRFIPAWAGNTLCGVTYSTASTVHPRVGGEHFQAPEPGVFAHGSSPRGRGTQHHGTSNRNIHRFIPAWAGNTGQTS